MYPSKRQITLADIPLGEPLPFSVYDVEGRVLLRKGVVVTMYEQVESLILRKAVMGSATPPAAQPMLAASARAPLPTRGLPEAAPAFEQVGSLILNLKHCYLTALKTPDQIDLPSRIAQFAARLQALCASDTDSALAAPHLDYVNPYLIVHQVMGAVLAECIGRRLGLEAQRRLPIVCAALTRGIGLAGVQNELELCDGPLPDALKRAVHAHPLQSGAILRRAGVADHAWLDSVEHYHERLDGGGYPQRLAGGAIGAGARMLAIADTYSAMTKPRPYRGKARVAQNALRDIYAQKDASLDGTLIQHMINEIGILPPGSIVRLKNGELAVIRQRTFKAAGAIAYTVYDPRGMPLIEPLRRDTSNPAHEITGMVPFTECRAAAVTIKRLWLK